jgi:hypothetical protein
MIPKAGFAFPKNVKDGMIGPVKYIDKVWMKTQASFYIKLFYINSDIS